MHVFSQIQRTSYTENIGLLDGMYPLHTKMPCQTWRIPSLTIILCTYNIYLNMSCHMCRWR